ncbi:6-phospho-beta-glucosidase [Clostridium tunisiense]|uniref:6-phospho-beta-glucosidase n=1 Tax=Clostridium tunisiense TaxID=219748 RepID=UPI00030812C4|nr:6-phospho-beta-glucosidase [Clostridium tunisiense]
MKGLKIAIIGGGSSYTPEIIEGFIKRSEELPVEEIHLVDIESGENKLNIVGNLARRMIDKAGASIKIVLTFDRKTALKDADFVVTQFRVGGLQARAMDERFPLKYGVLGQETTGPGGFAKALRTIPVILEICKDIEELCPEAWLINFTNPSGIITETVLKHTKTKCIGLCNVPIHMTMNIAKILEVEPKDIFIDFVGLNHLLWGKKVWYKEQDVTSKIIEGFLDDKSLTMKNIVDLKWDGEFLRALNMIPCPYHRYYYMTDTLVKEEILLVDSGKGTRAEQVQEVERVLFKKYSDPSLDVKPKELEKRGGAYYSEAAVSLISAIYNNKREVHVVNTRNNGAIDQVPEDSVIEVNCLIDSRGATPLSYKERLPVEISGLIQQVKSYEILAVEAAVKGDINKGLMALVANPLIPSVDTAKSLLKDLLEINKDYLPQFMEKQW